MGDGQCLCGARDAWRCARLTGASDRIACGCHCHRISDPRDAEIARLREELAEERRASTEYIQRTDPILARIEALSDQLAAAQADNAALRTVLETRWWQSRDDDDTGSIVWYCDECDGPITATQCAIDDGDVDATKLGHHREDCAIGKALATPAPGAPLLDAVMDLEAAATGWHNAECPGIDQGLPLGACCRQSTALAAVRAVLSRAQDTAGISRGGDSE